jgi:hypothetical protein
LLLCWVRRAKTLVTNPVFRHANERDNAFEYQLVGEMSSLESGYKVRLVCERRYGLIRERVDWGKLVCGREYRLD